MLVVGMYHTLPSRVHCRVDDSGVCRHNVLLPSLAVTVVDMPIRANSSVEATQKLTWGE